MEMQPRPPSRSRAELAEQLTHEARRIELARGPGTGSLRVTPPPVRVSDQCEQFFGRALFLIGVQDPAGDIVLDGLDGAIVGAADRRRARQSGLHVREPEAFESRSRGLREHDEEIGMVEVRAELLRRYAPGEHHALREAEPMRELLQEGAVGTVADYVVAVRGQSAIDVSEEPQHVLMPLALDQPADREQHEGAGGFAVGTLRVSGGVVDAPRVVARMEDAKLDVRRALTQQLPGGVGIDDHTLGSPEGATLQSETAAQELPRSRGGFELMAMHIDGGLGPRRHRKPVEPSGGIEKDHELEPVAPEESAEHQRVPHLERQVEDTLARPGEPIVDNMGAAAAGAGWTEEVQLTVGRLHEGRTHDLEQAGDATQPRRGRARDDEQR